VKKEVFSRKLADRLAIARFFTYCYFRRLKIQIVLYSRPPPIHSRLPRSANDRRETAPVQPDDKPPAAQTTPPHTSSPNLDKKHSKSRSNCAQSRNRSANDCSSSKNKRAPRPRNDRQIRRKNSGWSSRINSRHSNSSSMRKSKSSWNKNSSRSASAKRNPRNPSILQRNNLEVHGHFECFRRRSSCGAFAVGGETSGVNC